MEGFKAREESGTKAKFLSLSPVFARSVSLIFKGEGFFDQLIFPLVAL